MVIINIGMPRSGTLWRYKLIRDLVIASGGADGVQIRKKYLLHPIISGLNADINTLLAKRLIPAVIPSLFGERYVLNTHAKPTEIAESLLQKGRIKAVYGYRDPRDCILSMLEYGKRAKPEYSAVFLKLKNVEQAVNFMQSYLKIWDLWLAAPNTLVLKYEDMLEDFDSMVAKIVHHLELNVTPEEILKITNRYLPKQKPKERKNTHFEHGVAHRYRQEFNQGELSYMAEQLGPYLEKMGYPV